MNQLQVLTAATKLTTKALRIKRQLVRKSLWKAVCRDVHCKQFNEAEDQLITALEKFFKKQVKEVIKKLEQGRKLNQAFNIDAENNKLFDALFPPLTKIAIEGGLAQLRLMGISITRHRPRRKSTASEYLQREGLELPPEFRTDYPKWFKEGIEDLLNESFKQDYWDEINQTTKDDVERIMQQGLQEGLSIREMANEIEEKLDDEYYYGRSKNIARTESGNSLNGAKRMVMDDLIREVGDEVPMKMEWLSVLGSTTRATHADLDGVPADKNGMWSLGGIDTPWPGYYGLPAEERCNCFPGDVLVSGDFTGAQRGWYEGVVAEVVMGAAGIVSMTVNHPVMTDRGFVSAGSLNPGDKVLAYGVQADAFCFGSLVVGHSLPTSNQVNNKPAAIEQVFEAFSEWSIATSAFIEIRRSQVSDFYGDGVSLDGNIEIVRPNWKLLCDCDFGGFQKIGDTIFVLVPVGLSSEFSGGNSSLCGFTLDSASTSGPRIGKNPLYHRVPIGRISPFGSFRLGPAAHFDASVTQTKSNIPRSASNVFRDSVYRHARFISPHKIRNIKPSLSPAGSYLFDRGGLVDDDASSCEMPPESSVVARNFLRDAHRRFSSHVFFDEVLDVRKRSFSGHVYDLQSRYGHIVAYDPTKPKCGIVTKNCQCSTVISYGMDEDEAQQLLQDYYDRTTDEGGDEEEKFIITLHRKSNECHDEQGQFCPTGGGGGSKSDIAKVSAVRVAADIQRYSEEHNEPVLAKKIGGESLDDNEPVDVVVEIDGRMHGIELKTMTVGKNNKITMKKDAMDRKKSWERKNKGIVHTVVFDDTKVFNARGSGDHDFSQRAIFYRRGYGSFRVDKMYEVSSVSELKGLLSSKRSQLPIAAGGKKR